jgi:hypothetical protein
MLLKSLDIVFYESLLEVSIDSDNFVKKKRIWWR